MPPLGLGQLVERVSNVRDFDKQDVTETIETLTERQATELNDNEPFISKLGDDVHKLKDKLEDAFVGRDELIEMSLACFIAHLPMIALGPPGTAKSLVFRYMSKLLGLQQSPITVGELKEEMKELGASNTRGDPSKLLSKHVEADTVMDLLTTQAGLSDEDARKVFGLLTGAPGQRQTEAQVKDTQTTSTDGGGGATRSYFEYLVTRFTTPEEILGPADLDLMIHSSVFYRQTAGLLPEATTGFLDEIFKANSAILNAMLSIMQERIFYNAGRPVKVPLCMVFGASNEPPADKDLDALYDRFPIRVLCLPIDDTYSNLMKLLEKGIMHDCDETFNRQHEIKQIATVNHFRMLYRVLHVRFGGRTIDEHKSEFVREYCDTFKSLRREFQISERSFSRLYRVSRGLAIMRNHYRPKASELQVFKYCFRDPEAAAPLAEAVDDRIRRYSKATASR